MSLRLRKNYPFFLMAARPFSYPSRLISAEHVVIMAPIRRTSWCPLRATSRPLDLPIRCSEPNVSYLIFFPRAGRELFREPRSHHQAWRKPRLLRAGTRLCADAALRGLQGRRILITPRSPMNAHIGRSIASASTATSAARHEATKATVVKNLSPAWLRFSMRRSRIAPGAARGQRRLPRKLA